jgi:hypothetical protein
MNNIAFSCIPVVLLLLSACQDLCEEVASYPPSVQFGTGSSAFTPITDDTVLLPSWGAQGGTHIWGALQTTGLYSGTQTFLSGPQNPLTVNFSVSHQGIAFATVSDRFVVLEGSSASAEGYGFTIFMDGSPTDWAYDDDTQKMQIPFEVSAEVEVTDACGTTVSDKVSTLFSL